jgi:hypothetical protein
MLTQQLELSVFASIMVLGIVFLCWSFYHLCLDSRKARSRSRNRSSVVSRVQPGFGWRNRPRQHEGFRRSEQPTGLGRSAQRPMARRSA